MYVKKLILGQTYVNFDCHGIIKKDGHTIIDISTFPQRMKEQLLKASVPWSESSFQNFSSPLLVQRSFSLVMLFFVLFLCSGWDEGCMTMSQGEIAKLTIPSAKGYGSGGFPAWGYPFIYK